MIDLYSGLTKMEALNIVKNRLVAKQIVNCGALAMALIQGEMSERSKEAVLKTVGAQVPGGSNPSLSALYFCLLRFLIVECITLERCESGRIGLPAKELTW